VSPCKLSEQNFENFTIRGRFTKNAKIFTKFPGLATLAVITPQWLQMPKTHYQMVPLWDV